MTDRPFAAGSAPLPDPSTLIFGCGYLGRRVGQILVDRGQKVYGTTRSQDKASSLVASGIEPVIADVTRPESLDNFPTVGRILYCVGFDRGAGLPIRQVYVDGFKNALRAIADRQPACPIVYASSTGVYGGDDGEWVDESSPVEPRTESGQACFDAEQALAGHAGPSIILRYAGLYGPSRIMRLESLRKGEPVVGNADKFLNLIQIDDAAAITVRALEDVAGHRLEVFLISDGHPTTRSEFYGATAELLQAPSPRFAAPSPGSPEAKREGSNKRIDNRKMVDRWGDTLRYADVRSGLAASLDVEA